MDRRQREQREAKSRTAREFTESLPEAQPTAIPTEYGIQTVAEWIKTTPLREVYLYCRVSDREQNVKRQIKAACRELTKLGIKVRQVFCDVNSGKTMDRPGFLAVLKAAGKHGFPIATPCTSRLLTTSEHDSICNHEARPTVVEFKALMEHAKGATFLTLNDPDASRPDDRLFLSRLASPFKPRKRGRKRLSRETIFGK